MKKIAFASILALAFTSFACDDSDKDDPVIDNPNELEKKIQRS